MDPTRWNEIQDIFCEASEMQPGDRAAYLERTCGSDPALRAQVERFLNAIEESSGETIAQAIRAEAADLLSSEASALQTAGPYRLIRKIGQGGMGAVYLAERADREYDRQVAIKLAPPDVAGSAGRLLRFRMERQILANLDHPNISSMLDGGITETGVPYLVMEYVDGLAIDAYCRTNGLPLRDRIALFCTVCAAVEYAHRNLVIHRDIKPSNILVTAEGVPKLLDFGIAKLVAPGTAGMTLPAERLMTLEYASPEQLFGMPVTTATDVYALGIVLWELLTGRRLFESMKGQETPPRPSSAAGAAEARAMRGDLDEIALMALRKEPGARYASVEQFEEDLRRYLDGFPVRAAGRSGRYRAVKFVRRHRWSVAATAMLLLTLSGFGAAMSAAAARAARERDAARIERARTEQVSRFLAGLFAGSDPFQAQGREVTAKDLLDAGAHRITSELSGQPRVQAALLETIAQAYQHLGLKAEAEDMFRQQARAEEAAHGGDSSGLARALRQLGDVERQRSRLADAEADLRRALAVARKSGAELESAHTLNDLGLVLQSRGQLEEAQSLFEQAVSITRRYPEQITETLAMMSNLGSVLGERGDFDGAEVQLREVLRQRQARLGGDHPQTLLSMLRLGRLLHRRGSFAEAQSLYRTALARDQRVLGEQNPDTLTLTNNLAALLAEKGEFPEAEGLYRHIIEVGTRTLGKHADVALWRANLAGLLTQRLQYREAEPLFRESIEVCRATLGPGSTREARMLEQYALLLERTGQRSIAERNLMAALSIRREKLGEGHPDVAASLFVLAELRREQQRWPEAEDLYRQAIAIDRRAFPAGHLQRAAHELGYAAMLGASGRGGEAEPVARETLDYQRRALAAGAWQIAAGESVLGGILAAEGRYAEAEPLLVAGYTGLQRSPGERTLAAQIALRRLVDMYAVSGKTAQAAEYRKFQMKW